MANNDEKTISPHGWQKEKSPIPMAFYYFILSRQNILYYGKLYSCIGTKDATHSIRCSGCARCPKIIIFSILLYVQLQFNDCLL